MSSHEEVTTPPKSETSSSPPPYQRTSLPPPLAHINAIPFLLLYEGSLLEQINRGLPSFLGLIARPADSTTEVKGTIGVSCSGTGTARRSILTPDSQKQ